MVRVGWMGPLTSPQITIQYRLLPPKPPPPPLRPPHLHPPRVRRAGHSARVLTSSPTHQLAEGLYQTPLCTAHARNLVYTAARGQGRRFRLTRPGFNLAPAPTIYRISQPWEVGMEHNRGCNRLQYTWQCPTTPPRQVAGDIWRSRVVAPHREQYGVRAINPLSVISPKMSQGGGRSDLSPVLPLIFLIGTHGLHRNQETSLSRTFFWEPQGYGLPSR